MQLEAVLARLSCAVGPPASLTRAAPGAARPAQAIACPGGPQEGRNHCAHLGTRVSWACGLPAGRGRPETAAAERRPRGEEEWRRRARPRALRATCHPCHVTPLFLAPDPTGLVAPRSLVHAIRRALPSHACLRRVRREAGPVVADRPSLVLAAFPPTADPLMPPWKPPTRSRPLPGAPPRHPARLGSSWRLPGWEGCTAGRPGGAGCEGGGAGGSGAPGAAAPPAPPDPLFPLS